MPTVAANDDRHDDRQVAARAIAADARVSVAFSISPRPRLHDAEEPRADGFHAHRPRGGARRLPEARDVLRRARRGGVGLIVTGGAVAPSLVGRLDPSRLAASLRLANGQASRRDGRRARSRRAHCDADPPCRALCISPFVRRPVSHALADHAVPTAGADGLGVRRTIAACTCAAPSSRARLATTASRSWSWRAISSASSSRH